MQSRRGTTKSGRLRTAAQILARAVQIMKDRRQKMEAERAERERLRRDQEQAEQRRKHLVSLRGRETEFGYFSASFKVSWNKQRRRSDTRRTGWSRAAFGISSSGNPSTGGDSSGNNTQDTRSGLAYRFGLVRGKGLRGGIVPASCANT